MSPPGTRPHAKKKQLGCHSVEASGRVPSGLGNQCFAAVLVFDVAVVAEVAVVAVVPVAEVSVVDIVPVVPVADVPLVDIVAMLPEDAVSVAVVIVVSVAAVSVFVFSSFLHANANVPASTSASSVRTKDFFIRFRAPSRVGGNNRMGNARR